MPSAQYTKSRSMATSYELGHTRNAFCSALSAVSRSSLCTVSSVFVRRFDRVRYFKDRGRRPCTAARVLRLFCHLLVETWAHDTFNPANCPYHHHHQNQTPIHLRPVLRKESFWRIPRCSFIRWPSHLHARESRYEGPPKDGLISLCPSTNGSISDF